MAFEKQVIIRNEGNVDYVIRLVSDTDLHTSLYIGSPILFRIYSNDVDITNVLSDVILTNNYNKTYNTYTQPNPNLAVLLYEKLYDIRTAEFYLNLVSQNIGDDSSSFFQCNDIISGNVNIFLVESYLTQQSSNVVNFRYNTEYVIGFDLNIISNVLKNNNIIDGNTFTVLSNSEIVVDKKVYVSLITQIASANELTTKAFSDYCNNVIFKLNNLNYLSDIKYMLDYGDKFNYQFTPVNDNAGVIQQEIDSDGNPVLIKIDIQNQIEDLFLAQFLPEYINYFKTLDEEVDVDNLVLLRQIKKLFYGNTNLLNASTKGILDGIFNITNVFCDMMGCHFLVVEPSPVLHNFIYRVTTSLPQHYWTGIVKSIIHPLSWKDEYVFIDADSNLPNVNILTGDHYKNRLQSLILQLTQLPNTYMDVSFKPPYNYIPHFYELASSYNFDTHFTFPFEPNEYHTTLGYDDPSLVHVLSNSNNIVLLTTFNSEKQLYMTSVEYVLTGLALEYEFSIYSNGELIQHLNSYSPLYNCELPNTITGKILTVSITLKNSKFENYIICIATRDYQF